MFKFKFQTVLNYKRQIEEVCQQDFAGSKQAWIKEIEILKKYHERWEACMNEWRSLHEGSFPICEISLYQRYMLKLKHEIIQQAEKVRNCLQEMDKKREVLLGALKDKKIMEKLREQCFAEYSIEESKKEKKFLDAMATQRFNFNRS